LHTGKYDEAIQSFEKIMLDRTEAKAGSNNGFAIANKANTMKRDGFEDAIR
jgi:hypothetical protein